MNTKNSECFCYDYRLGIQPLFGRAYYDYCIPTALQALFLLEQAVIKWMKDDTAVFLGYKRSRLTCWWSSLNLQSWQSRSSLSWTNVDLKVCWIFFSQTGKTVGDTCFIVSVSCFQLWFEIRLVVETILHHKRRFIHHCLQFFCWINFVNILSFCLSICVWIV